MAMPKQWKIVGAAAVAAGLGVGAVAAAQDGSGSDGGRIPLRDRQDVGVEGPRGFDDDRGGDRDRVRDRVDESLRSPDGESLDSPFQSVDDSPPGADSVDSPEYVVAPPPPPPAPAPVPPPPPPPPPAPVDDSPASFDSVSVDSP